MKKHKVYGAHGGKFPKGRICRKSLPEVAHRQIINGKNEGAYGAAISGGPRAVGWGGSGENFNERRRSGGQ